MRPAWRLVPLLVGALAVTSLFSPPVLLAPTPRPATASLAPPAGLPRPERPRVDTTAHAAARALAADSSRGAALRAQPAAIATSDPAAAPAAVTWAYLSDLPWDRATSGLLDLADRNQPSRDQAFPRRTPLVVAGQPYDKGIGTLPFSEIEYALPPDAVTFRARVGLNDLPEIAAGSAVFHVYGDGVELYTSEVVRRGDAVRSVEVGIAGVQRLRLVVTDAGDGVVGDYADWIEAVIGRDPAAAGAASPLAETLRSAEAARRQAVEGEEGRLFALAAAELAVADQVLQHAAQGPATSAGARTESGLHLAAAASGQAPAAAPADGPPPDGAPAGRADGTPAGPAGGAAPPAAGPSPAGGTAASAPALSADGVRAVWDAQRSLLLLSSDAVLLTLGLGGSDHGYLSAVDRRRGRLLFYDTTPALRLTSGSMRTLHADTAPDPNELYALAPVSDATLGRGTEVVVPLHLVGEPGRVVLRLALFADQPHFTVQFGAEDLAPGQAVRGYTYFADTDAGGFVMGDHGAYLADRSRLWTGDVRDDGYVRRASLEPTKPLILWNGPDTALLATLLDCLDGPAYASFRRDLGRAVAGVDLAFDDALAERAGTSPRLLVEVLPGADLRRAGTDFRRIMGALYPSAPAPTWLRNQLGSWYVFGPGVDDARLRQQVDYLAEYLPDMGPWHIVIDAGWHVAYGGPDAEFRNVDYERFPNGIRSLVDYAHARGVRIVLYLPTGYVHDGRGDGEWLALPEMVRTRPEWLSPLYTQGEVGRFLLDYRLPAVQRHIERTLEQALVEFDADGISMDGLADAEGQLIPLPLRQTWQGVAPIQRSHEIYELFARHIYQRKPDAYIETGWITPTCANPHATTFRYADETSEYENPYPFGGFETHLDYAIVQRMLFGQRANMGANFGDPNRPDALTWLRGALATGVQATLSFDLWRMSPETLARYRAHLAHYHPFVGETRFDGGALPNTFATVRGPLVYLGAINREHTPRTQAVSLSDLGLDPTARYTYYDPEQDRFGQVSGGFDVALPGKAFRLYVLRREPGVLWTPSSFDERAVENGVQVQVQGPANVPGVLWLASPPPTAVHLDGVPLAPLADPDATASGYRYDVAAGVVEVRYQHGAARTVDVRWESAAAP